MTDDPVNVHDSAYYESRHAKRLYPWDRILARDKLVSISVLAYAQTQLTIFVRITTDTCYTIHRKVKLGQISIHALQERHQEASQTAIDMQTQFVLSCELGEVGDRIYGAVGKVWCGSDEHDRIGVTAQRVSGKWQIGKKIDSHGARHSLDVCLSGNLVYRNDMQPDTKVV